MNVAKPSSKLMTFDKLSKIWKPARHIGVRWAPVIFVATAASLLLLLNLGNQYLWQDEAQTALIAGTILTHGIPLGYDGKNYFSQQSGAEYGKNYVWRWHPWLPFYVLAMFFALFGKSTLVARLPFALFGIATVILTYYAGKELWGTRRAGFFCALALLITVPFFLLARQCRLYSLAMFFSLLGLYAYAGIIEGRRRSCFIFGIAAFLLFHTFYVYYASLLATVILHSLALRRVFARRVIGTCLVTLAVNAPWIVWFSGMKYTTEYKGNLFDISRALGQSKHFIYLLCKHVTPWWLLIIPLIALGVGRLLCRAVKKPSPQIAENVALTLLFSVLTMAAIALSSPAPFFRYLAPLVPVCALLMGLILEFAAQAHTFLAIGVIAALAVTGKIPDYLYEITHDYDGPIEGIVKYLEQNANPEDIVAVTYEDLPIKFYTNLKVIGGLTGEDLTPARNADWVVMRRHYVGGGADRRNAQYFAANIPWHKYQQITLLDYPDTPFENREGPEEHRFRTAKDERPVVIYHKVLD